MSTEWHVATILKGTASTSLLEAITQYGIPSSALFGSTIDDGVVKHTMEAKYMVLDDLLMFNIVRVQDVIPDEQISIFLSDGIEDLERTAIRIGIYAAYDVTLLIVHADGRIGSYMELLDTIPVIGAAIRREVEDIKPAQLPEDVTPAPPTELIAMPAGIENVHPESGAVFTQMEREHNFGYALNHYCVSRHIGEHAVAAAAVGSAVARLLKQSKVPVNVITWDAEAKAHSIGSVTLKYDVAKPDAAAMVTKAKIGLQKTHTTAFSFAPPSDGGVAVVLSTGHDYTAVNPVQNVFASHGTPGTISLTMGRMDNRVVLSCVNGVLTREFALALGDATLEAIQQVMDASLGDIEDTI